MSTTEPRPPRSDLDTDTDKNGTTDTETSLARVSACNQTGSEHATYVRGSEEGLLQEIEKATGSNVHGEKDHEGIKCRTMVWWKVAALMLAETVSLRVLTIPSVFARVGIVAGCLLVIGLGVITTATGYMLGQFKLRYPHVHNMADVGQILAGPIGREVLGAAQLIFLLFLCGNHLLTGLVAFDTITAGASCSVVWAAVTTVVCLILTLPRTLNGIAYMSIVSFISILIAVLVMMTGVAAAGHQGGVQVTAHLKFAKAFVAVTDIVFAFAGHVAFFTFIAEMAQPQDFPKALYAYQIADTTLYLVVGVVIYAYAGSTSVSPALGYMHTHMRKVAYGFALPTIVIAGAINGHVCANLVYVRIFRRDGVHSRHMTRHSWTGWLTWIMICTVVLTLAFVIAEVIPFFHDLFGVISSIFASWFTYGISGIFWFHLNPRAEIWTTWRQKLKTIFWAGIIAMGGFIMVAGLYASIRSMIDGYRERLYHEPFTCANQALS